MEPELLELRRMLMEYKYSLSPMISPGETEEVIDMALLLANNIMKHYIVAIIFILLLCASLMA